MNEEHSHGRFRWRLRPVATAATISSTNALDLHAVIPSRTGDIWAMTDAFTSGRAIDKFYDAALGCNQ